MAAGQTTLQTFIPTLKSEPALADLGLCIYIGVALLLLRLSCEALLIPVLAKRLAGIGKQNPHRLAVKVFDDAYTSLGAGILVAWAWGVLLLDSGGCTPANLTPCLAHWPNIPTPLPSRIFWISMWGFYTYELLGTAIKRGTILPPIMVAHHLASMVLMALVYVNSGLRIGLMATALLDLSNPLLHAAKTLKHLGLPAWEGVNNMLFNVFAVVFLVARVVMPPFTIIKLCLVDARVFPTVGYYVQAVFMVVVYGMQLFWFYKIVKIAVGREEAPKEE